MWIGINRIISRDMNAEQPLVSVLMTCYNREHTMADAIQSVLDSTHTNFELIIVDDCSKDNSYNVALAFAQKDARIRVYKNEENLGDYPNRNKAASYAKGKYLKYNDSDEELYYFGLQIMVECMERFPEAAVGFCQIHDEKKHPYLISSHDAYYRHYFKGMFFINAPTSSLIRRDIFEQEGGFRPIRHRGDYDLWLRLAAKYPVVRLPAFMGWNYSHPGQELSKNMLYKKALNYNVSMGALDSPDCPLSKQEIAEAKQRWQRGYIRQNIFGNILKMNFKNALYLQKEAKIGFAAIFSALS